MSHEVKILSGRLLGKGWPDFEHQVAQYVNEGWVVIGFAAERDAEHGDIAYTMLQREVAESRADDRPAASPSEPMQDP